MKHWEAALAVTASARTGKYSLDSVPRNPSLSGAWLLRQAAAHWEAALAVNPLHAEGWFALGFCALKGADAARAAQAFTRAAQQDPDNGEAWNNLAAVHLQARGLLELYCLM